MDRGRCADDVAALEPALAAGEVADHSAGLADQQRAGGDVPRREMQLEEAVENAGGRVGEIERCRAGPAYTFRDTNNALEYLAINRHEFLCSKRKARGQERSFDGLLIGDVHPLAIAERARAALGGEEEIAQRLVDEAGNDLVASFSPIDTDQNGKCCR